MSNWTSPIQILHHGDALTAQFLNNLAADIREVHDLFNQYPSPWQVPTLYSYEQLPGWGGFNDSGWTACRNHRFLYYRSSGNIESVDGSLSPVALANTNDPGVNVKDLDEISWLSYGRLFRITGVTWCFMKDE